MSAIDQDKHIKTYMIVFVTLLALTVVTVAISYLHMSVIPAIALGLFVATVKGSLVAAYFMHLIGEKKLIIWVLIFTALFVLGLLLLPVFMHADRLENYYVS